MNKPRTKNSIARRETVYKKNSDETFTALILDKKKKHCDFIKNFRRGEEMLSYKEMGLFSMIINRMDYANMVSLTFREMEKYFKIDKTTACRCVKLLIENDYMKKVKMGVYMINPDYATCISPEYADIVDVAYSTGNFDRVKELIAKKRADYVKA